MHTESIQKCKNPQVDDKLSPDAIQKRQLLYPWRKRSSGQGITIHSSYVVGLSKGWKSSHKKQAIHPHVKDAITTQISEKPKGIFADGFTAALPRSRMPICCATKIGCVPKMKGLSLPPTTWNVKFTQNKNQHECISLTCTRQWQKQNVKQQTEDLWNMPSRQEPTGCVT